jgi:hypothetical protein
MQKIKNWFTSTKHNITRTIGLILIGVVGGVGSTLLVYGIEGNAVDQITTMIMTEADKLPVAERPAFLRDVAGKLRKAIETLNTVATRLDERAVTA